MGWQLRGGVISQAEGHHPLLDFVIRESLVGIKKGHYEHNRI